MKSTNNPPLLIVGLGNPDPKYLKTRHNIGFWLLDSLAEKYNLSFNDNLIITYKIDNRQFEINNIDDEIILFDVND